MKIFNQNGQSLVELVLTIGVAALLIPAIASSFITSRQGKPQEIERTYATATLKETEKAVEAIRDNNWTTFANLSGAATWYPSLPGNTWIAASGTETLISGVTRQFVVTNVNRDASGNIVTSGGTSDPSTKKVDITISWLLPYSSSITST